MRGTAFLPMAIRLGTALLLSFSAQAHVGPPFPVLVDQPIPGYAVTVWADPDVGEAVFYVTFEPDGTVSTKSNTSTNTVSGVEIWVQPVSGRLDRALYTGTRQPARRHLRYVAKPEFDAAEPWSVGVEIRMTDGSNHPLVMQVEATPPGLGSWDLVIYLFPFVLFGGLWALVFVRRGRRRTTKESSRSDAGPSVPATPLNAREPAVKSQAAGKPSS